MNENSNPEILITIIILSVLLAILSVTTAFCHTERSAGYKNKVNIGKKNHIIIYPIFFVLHMTAILLFNLPFPDLTCYLSFSIGSIVFIFLIQAVIAYFTMFKKVWMRYGYKSRQINCFFAHFNTILQYPFWCGFCILNRRYKCTVAPVYSICTFHKDDFLLRRDDLCLTRQLLPLF